MRRLRDPGLITRVRSVGKTAALVADVVLGMRGGGVKAARAIGRALADGADELDELPQAGVSVKHWMMEALVERMTTVGSGRAYVAGQTRVFWMREGTWRITYAGPAGQPDQVTDEIVEIIWRNGPLDVERNGLRAWSPVESDSELESTIADEVRPFLRAARGRGVLLYGPPGTGKTTAAWGASARLRREGLAPRIATVSAETSALSNAVDLRPNVVVIDDLDRLSVAKDDGALAVMGGEPQFPASVLADLSRLRAMGATLIVTSNRTDRVDAAALRSQRIDRWILVDRVPDDAFAALTRGFPAAAVPFIKEWTMADLQTVRDEVDVAGRDAGVVVAQMLAERARER